MTIGCLLFDRTSRTDNQDKKSLTLTHDHRKNNAKSNCLFEYTNVSIASATHVNIRCSSPEACQLPRKITEAVIVSLFVLRIHYDLLAYYNIVQ